ncbi:MAG: hypothetical protein JSS21_04150 [Proteobacteria bacterium]|nr:hypothetical protein [Pseudomonadota bacterium]
MPEQWPLFKEGDRELGIFYPYHYIVAGYSNMAEAQAAEAACRKAGFADEDVRAVSGEFMMKLESREEAGWLDRTKAKLAEFMGTEAAFLHEDAELARGGGAFLFIHAPDDSSVDRARRVFSMHGPRYARRYLEIAIEHIVKNADANWAARRHAND